MGKKHSFEYIQKFIEKKDGTLLSDKYINAREPLHIKCNKDGHEWYPIFSNINKGQWCPKCSNRIKPTIDYIKQFVENKNGTLISNIYTNNRTKLHIKCNYDNCEWFPPWTNLQRGQWCPRCSQKEKNNIFMASHIADKYNGKCLSDEYINAHSKLKWQCEKGHIWYATLGKVKNSKTWCPKCPASKAQTELYNIIVSLFPYRSVLFNYKGFKWLKTSKYGHQELDIYVKDIKLAIEYDGEQHFVAKNHFGGMEGLKRTQLRDKLKDTKIRQNTDDVKYFIRFSYKEPITAEYVKNKILHHVGDLEGRYR